MNLALRAARIEGMASMFRQGLTLQKIGDHYAVTREYVRQLIRRVGLSRLDGGQHAQSVAKKIRKVNALERRVFALWGLDVPTWRARRKDGWIGRFVSHRNAAKSRGIGFCLTFPEWYHIWQTSGKQPGRGKTGFCMSRIKDDGPYELGNVHIQSCVANSKEAVKKWKGKTKPNRGVYHLYPGLRNPWLSKYGKTRIGYYATEADAVAARDQFIRLASNPNSDASDKQALRINESTAASAH